jgi:D-alanine-D-alanine ligase
VLYYGDEGRDCRYSADFIRATTRRASRVLVLRPVRRDGRVVIGRRGQRTYRLAVEGDSIPIGARRRNSELIPVLLERLDRIQKLTDRRARLAVVVTDLRLQSFPQRAPHAATVTIRVGYPTSAAADRTEAAIREILGRRHRWRLRLVSDRPPMPRRAVHIELARQVASAAERWEIPVLPERSVLPSAAGLVPAGVACLCGLGPIAEDLNTPSERISRFSLVQRTLLLAQILVAEGRRT